MNNQNDLEILRSFFENFGVHDHQFMKSIQNFLMPVSFDKQPIIFLQNEPATSIFFLPNGIARYYVVDIKGKEYTKSFRIGPTFLGSVYATHGGKINPFSAEILSL